MFHVAARYPISSTIRRSQVHVHVRIQHLVASSTIISRITKQGYHSATKRSLVVSTIGELAQVRCFGVSSTGTDRSSSSSSLSLAHRSKNKDGPCNANDGNIQIRLYRILYRQVLELEKQYAQKRKSNTNNIVVLLHPPLEPRRIGHSRIFSNFEANTCQVEHVLRLFYHWEKRLHHPTSSSQQQLTDRYQDDEEDEDDDNDDEDDDEDEPAEARLGTIRRGASDGDDGLPLEDAQNDGLKQLQKWIQSTVTTPSSKKDFSSNIRDDMTLWTTPQCLRQALRMAFQSPPKATDNKTTNSPALSQRLQLHWWIRAYRYLLEQCELATLTTINEVSSSSSSSPTAAAASLVKTRQQSQQRHPRVRVTAVARCVGRSLGLHAPETQQQRSMVANFEPKYRFVYRLRIENMGYDHDDYDDVHSTNHAAADDKDETQHSFLPSCTIQLLGRSWIIHEEEGEEQAKRLQTRKNPPIRVHAPLSGAVGKHAVLHPGQALEYFSGCDLATPVGRMEGCFYFAIVPPNTPTASVGQFVAALNTTSRDGNNDIHNNDDNGNNFVRFQVSVTPFPLRGENPLNR